MMDSICAEHDFPEQQDFCTHIGHANMGAHSRHYVCRKCGALKTVHLGKTGITIRSAAEAMNMIYFWGIISEPHRCIAGWRGKVIVDISSEAVEAAGTSHI